MSNAPLFLPNLKSKEQQLWLALRRGNKNAFSIIFNKYYNDLYFFGLKLIGDETLVKDTIQDLLASIWERRETLGEIEYVKTYLITSFRRELIRSVNTSRKLIERKLLLKNNLYDFELSREDLIIQDNSQSENILRLEAAFQNLQPTQREIIYLRYYNGFDDQEISEILDIKYQSVRNRLHRALKALRKTLNASSPESYQINY